MVLDECDRLARAQFEIVLRDGFTFEITSRGTTRVLIEATYMAVAYPLATWDDLTAKRIRDLHLTLTGDSVIADF